MDLSPFCRLADAASVGRLHIVAIAALGTLTFGVVFTGHHAWACVALTALDWFLVNLLNRTVDLAEDRTNRIRATELAARHAARIRAAGLGLLAGSLAISHALWPALTPARLGYHALGAAYNWPLLPGRRRLKQLYFWKNTASAAGFLITCFGYPLLLHGPVWTAETGPANVGPAALVLTLAFFLLFEVSYEIVYDLRDAPGDAQAGVRSYPVVHGPVAAARLAFGLMLGSAAILAVGWATGALPWRVAVMGTAPLIQIVLVRRALRRGLRAADCIRLTWLGAGLLATWHLWELAGLPGA